jgi:hypothetical protein
MPFKSKRQVEVRIGPISEDHGDSLHYDNVIPSSIRLLNRLNRDAADKIKTEYSHTLDLMRNAKGDSTLEGYLFEALLDALREEIPWPYYFGANEKDGRIGVWDRRSPTGH